MPPARRTTSTPAPKGRRPKIAGQQAARRTPPSDATPVERTDEQSGQDPRSVEPQASPLATVPPAPETAAEGESTPAADAADTAPESAAPGGTTEGATASEAPAPGRPVNRTSALRPRQRAGDESAGAESAVEEAVDPAVVSRGWRRVVAIGVAALALAAFAVVAAFRPGADVPNRAWVDTSATTQVAAAARNAIQTLYTYKFDTVDQDFDNARAVLTERMRAEFDKTAQVTRDAVIQTKTATEAQVTDIGVKLLDDGQAELVASMNVSASNDGVAQGSAEGPLSVTMSKVGDTWLLADIRDR